MTEFNGTTEIVTQADEFEPDPAAMEEANYWFTINEFIELMLRYGPQRVIPDFEKQMEKAKQVIRDRATAIIVPE